MTHKENMLRAARFDTPQYIPVLFDINPACWNHYPHDALQELMKEHTLLFPDFTPVKKVKPLFSPVQRKDHPYQDAWGCVWTTAEDGITGVVTNHPLSDLAALATYKPPDPQKTNGRVPINWDQLTNDIRVLKKQGQLAKTSLVHGHTFLRLCDLCGYENLMFHMADADPRLWKLIELVETFNLTLINRYLALGAECMGYPDDLGMQSGPMLSPEHFRKYIKPVYQRIMAPARNAGAIVQMHSDGDLRSLVPDLIECGVEIINLQDLVNGIDWIAANLKGRICIQLDIDRQNITAHGTPQQIDALIRGEVAKLGTPKGGLMMCYGLYPGVPLENVKAVMDAMEKYATCFA